METESWWGVGWYLTVGTQTTSPCKLLSCQAPCWGAAGPCLAPGVAVPPQPGIVSALQGLFPTFSPNTTDLDPCHAKQSWALDRTLPMLVPLLLALRRLQHAVSTVAGRLFVHPKGHGNRYWPCGNAYLELLRRLRQL